jgi:Na+-driven multidrug efflux pump
MGVAGAGLASSICVALGVLLLWLYYRKLEHYMSFDARLGKFSRSACRRAPSCC